MSAYRTADTPDRLKAAAAVLAVHMLMAFVILTGLNVKMVAAQVERLKTFDITEDAPPPPEPIPPPTPDDSSAPRDEAAPANIKSKPTPVEAPTPPIPLPIEQKIASSEVRGPEGADRTAGASNRPGSGTGAGGQGSGFGGGGSGGYGTGFTTAQRISRIPNREHRRLVAVSRRSRATVGIPLKLNTDGRPSNCRIARTSGDKAVDSLMCELALQYVRFRAARDPQGRAVAQDITWYPDWAPNF